ncbi:MAG: phasin family protein [Gammaproteobacteria bacterium]|nr:phasin family protein [Gammaproteobacteria bacterium]MCY4218864.1 phasin family protein [Gammaproteobacteria bacterium]MCY4274484.1 phasin family protein [Gammaproteobacteria bacterium]
MNTEKINKALAPAVEFNRLVLNNMKTVFSMQTESLRAYAELGFKNLNDGLDVKSVEDLKTYAESQQSVIKEVGEQVTRDLEALGEMNAKFVEEARKLSVNK